jgi:hypothetical protein
MGIAINKQRNGLTRLLRGLVGRSTRATTRFFSSFAYFRF